MVSLAGAVYCDPSTADQTKGQGGTQPKCNSWVQMCPTIHARNRHHGGEKKFIECVREFANRLWLPSWTTAQRAMVIQLSLKRISCQHVQQNDSGGIPLSPARRMPWDVLCISVETFSKWKLGTCEGMGTIIWGLEDAWSDSGSPGSGGPRVAK